MEKRYCATCQQLINTTRLKVLPHTQTCVKCSRVRPLTERDIETDTSDQADMVRMVAASSMEMG